MPFPVPVRCCVSSRARLVAAAAARVEVVNGGVLPCLDRRRRAADDGAVFHDVVAGCDVRDGDLVAVGQGATELELAFSFAAEFAFRIGGTGVDQRRDVVVRVKHDRTNHGALAFRCWPKLIFIGSVPTGRKVGFGVSMVSCFDKLSMRSLCDCEALTLSLSKGEC